MNFYRSSVTIAQDSAPAYTAKVNNTLCNTNMAYALANQRTLDSEIVIGKNVVNLRGALENCINLSKPVTVIGNEPITDCGNFLYNCRKLNTNVIINRPINNAQSMFAECQNLECDLNLILTEDTPTQDMFKNCYKLKGNVQILPYTSTGNYQINGTRLFDGCANIAGANIGEIKHNAAFMFNGCKNLKSCQIANNSVMDFNNAAYMFAGCQNLTFAPDVHANMNAYPKANFSHCFDGCYSLTNANIMRISGVPSYDESNFESVFRNCRNLSDGLRAEYVLGKNMMNAFRDCWSLNRVSYIGYLAYDVNYYAAYMNCYNLNSQIIMNAYLRGNFMYTLAGCSNLSDIKIERFNMSHVWNYSMMLDNKNKAHRLNIKFNDHYDVSDLASLQTAVSVMLIGGYGIQWTNTGTYKCYNSEWNIYIE